MFGLYEQPLQARPSLIFPFLPFFCPPVLSPAWMGWLSPIPFRRCPGFAHNWPTRLQQGWSGASLVSFLYPVLKLAKNRRTGASLDFLPRTSLPLPLKGEGPGIVCLGFVGFAPLGHSCLTRLQQGRFGGWLVFAPYSASKTAHRATQGRVWFSPLFPGALWVWQSYQIPLQLVFHCFLGGSDRVTQIPVPHQACLCFYLRRFRINESLLFKLPNVLGNRVSAHSCVLADPSKGRDCSQPPHKNSIFHQVLVEPHQDACSLGTDGCFGCIHRSIIATVESAVHSPPGSFITPLPVQRGTNNPVLPASVSCGP